jgi:hypothetical protein
MQCYKEPKFNEGIAGNFLTSGKALTWHIIQDTSKLSIVTGVPFVAEEQHIVQS